MWHQQTPTPPLDPSFSTQGEELNLRPLKPLFPPTPPSYFRGNIAKVAAFLLRMECHVDFLAVTRSWVPPLPLAQALPCLSTRARLTVVFLTFSVLAQGGGRVKLTVCVVSTQIMHQLFCVAPQVAGIPQEVTP